MVPGVIKLVPRYHRLGICGSGARVGFRFLISGLETTECQNDSQRKWLGAFQGGNRGVGRTGATDHLFGEVHVASQQAHSSTLSTLNHPQPSTEILKTLSPKS